MTDIKEELYKASVEKTAEIIADAVVKKLAELLHLRHDSNPCGVDPFIQRFIDGYTAK